MLIKTAEKYCDKLNNHNNPSWRENADSNKLITRKLIDIFIAISNINIVYFLL